jgi:hypothetical protein
MIDPDLGYYVCNGVSFSSKVDACIYATTVKKPIEWIFHQDKFSTYPWHIEPEESLDYFYDKRARELREKYDYLILNYSGGSDSNNILESFIRQNLHLDEIVTNHITKATENLIVLDPKVKNSWNLNAEYKLQALPRLQYITDKFPRTKITALDVSDSIINDINKYDDANWVLHRSEQLSPINPLRFNYFYYSQIKKQFDKNLKIAVIQGVDKPITSIKDGEFSFSFSDVATNMTTINNFNTDYENVKTELFYWSSETMPMICKQVHSIKRWLEERPPRQQFWLHGNFATARLYHEKFLRNIIYTTWNSDWFQVDKGVSWWHTEFDTWFRTNTNFKKQYENWERGINYLETLIPQFITYKDNRPDGLIKYRQTYHIGKLKNLYKNTP